jgi:hypothetical protein
LLIQPGAARSITPQLVGAQRRFEPANVVVGPEVHRLGDDAVVGRGMLVASPP